MLVIDTATTMCSVALFDDTICVAADQANLGKGHAEHLVPMINALPDRGFAHQIWVNSGPGSFTGVRIGMSAARALSFAWDAELQVYGCLQITALQAVAELNYSAPLCVVNIGGHGEFFVQNFNSLGEPLAPFQSLPPEALRDFTSADVIAGSAVGRVEHLMSATRHISTLPIAKSAMLLSASHLSYDILPQYGRAPDAKALETIAS